MNTTTVEVNLKEKAHKQIEYILISLCFNVGITFVLLVMFKSVLAFNILMGIYLAWAIIITFGLILFYVDEFDHKNSQMISEDKRKTKFAENLLVNAAMWNMYPPLRWAAWSAIVVMMLFAYYISITFAVKFGAIVMAFIPLSVLIIRWVIYTDARKFFKINGE